MPDGAILGRMIRMSAHIAGSDPTLPSGVDAEALLGLAAGYHERTIRLMGVEEFDDQLTKVYAIEAPGRTVTPGNSEQTLRLARQQLRTDRATGSLGLGCVILHAGGDGDYVLVHSWVEGYMSRLGDLHRADGRRASAAPASAGLAPCVWEAEVLAHERVAFIRHVLAGSGPLQQRLDAWSADALTVAPQAAA
jgi:hypothetical protein